MPRKKTRSTSIGTSQVTQPQRTFQDNLRYSLRERKVDWIVLLFITIAFLVGMGFCIYLDHLSLAILGFTLYIPVLAGMSVFIFSRRN